MHVASLFPVPAVPELNQLFHEIELNELMQTELGTMTGRPIRIENAGRMHMPDHVKPVAPIDAYECVSR